ncbi:MULTISPECIES: cytochrome P450 [Streptomyces]|uniref:cytochrome P450 n=1 Tax=Streptomyces TaxID=1883 RepID=UPI001C502523|nr:MULTISPECIES: cytochrome P450 [Streptomyces]MCX4714010.1 cytochrome P450 [Streptomyces griseus]QXR01056.1 cytochrome P450 [Streptomyces sp. WY228]
MVDSTLPLLIQGYAWLPDRRRRSGGAPVRTRLLGKKAIALHGPAAVRFFYDEQHIHRQDALPQPVIDTLFGQGAVHTLDGERHRVRKALFTELLKDPSAVRELADQVDRELERAGAEWSGHQRVVLFDALAKVLTRAVHTWAGVPLAADELRYTARDLIAMVDGFATVGPRHLRARRARRRQEERLTPLVEAVRAEPGPGEDGPGSTVFRTVAAHKDAGGALLTPHTAAVEVLNVLRPTVAITWFAVFAAHALHRHPGHRSALAADGPGYGWAFAQEVRRFYPFAPFVGGLAAERLEWAGRTIAPGTMVLLDLYGLDHDPDLWPEPYRFDPSRFLSGPAPADALVPQGGGPVDGHRCPGEDVTVSVLATVARFLARSAYEVPEQDLRIPLERIPTAPRSGFVVSGFAVPPADRSTEDQHPA